MSNPTGDSPYASDVKGRASSPAVETAAGPQARGTGDGLVGLVLVHGIGEQRPGDTLAKFLTGIEESFPSVDIDVETDRVGRAHLRSGTRSVRVYEAHWAHLLSDGFVEGTFRRDALFEIGWFPLLNHRGWRPRGAQASRVGAPFHEWWHTPGGAQRLRASRPLAMTSCSMRRFRT